MLDRMQALLKPAPYQPIETDYRYWMAQVFNHWRMRVCFSIFFGYAVFYFTRKSLSFAAPFIVDELGFQKADFGLLASTLYITYGISKFVSGVSADRSNPRYFMAIGLMVTGVCNILFSFCSSMWLFMVFWALNGWFQAWGWPASCKLLNFWFAKQERGLWYSICSTSHNLGGAIIPLLAAWAATQYGWRYALMIPGVISIFMAVALIILLRDVPRSLKLPTVEDFKADPEEYTDLVAEKKHALLPHTDILKIVLFNRFVWMFALSYFFIYVVRTAVNDWTPFYLIEVKNFAKEYAGFGVTAFELGGFAGMILTGFVSDIYWKGNRVPSMVICALGLALCIVALWCTPVGFYSIDLTLLALIGAFVFGPQMIVGLAAAEYVDKRSSSAANGFAGTMGYFGAAFTGYPVGMMLDHYGWDSFFVMMTASSIVVACLLLPLWTNRPKTPLKCSTQEVTT